jgi:hypothetical protein
MTTFRKGQTVYYDAQENPNRPIRARIERCLKDGRYRVTALWALDPVTGKEPDIGYLGYGYVIDGADLRATFERKGHMELRFIAGERT